MHNGQTANPLNEFSKEIKKVSGKRAKTDADLEELARLEWHAGLYLKDGKPCIPGEVLEATLVEAAKKIKMKKNVQAGLYCDGFFPIVYDGSANLKELWEDRRFRFTAIVRVKNNRIPRTRPIFQEWSAEVMITYDDGQLNPSTVRELLVAAGNNVGLMDWRPKFGRFKVV